MGAPGVHLVEDGLCAAAAALASGALGAKPLDAIADGARELRGRARARGAAREPPDGLRVLDDCYNANPHSVGARARDAGRSSRGGERAVAVLGDMLELGDAGRGAARRDRRARPPRAASTCWSPSARSSRAHRGGRARGGARDACSSATTPTAAAQLVREHARAGDVVLVKASRGMRSSAS